MGENKHFLGDISILHSVIISRCYFSDIYIYWNFGYQAKFNLFFCLFIFFNSDHSKNLLIECTASHLKHKKVTATYGARLTSSSGRILLQSVPGGSLTHPIIILHFHICAFELHCLLLELIASMMMPSIGTELYRERLVRALARDLQVPLLVLDSSVLAPYVRFEYFRCVKMVFLSL